MMDKLTLLLKYDAKELALSCRLHALSRFPGVHVTCLLAAFHCPFGEKPCSDVTKRDWQKLIRKEREEHD